jgi:hypothetical protein
MKIYIYGLLLFFIFSCTTTRVVNNTSKSSITGSWKLTGIEQPAEESTDKTPLFDVPTLTCLEGSVWHFNDDKTSGTITLNGSSCIKSLREIHWLIYEPGNGTVNFQFKYVVTGVDTSKINAKGYQTMIDKMDGSVMVMHTNSNKDSTSNTILTFNKVTP